MNSADNAEPKTKAVRTKRAVTEIKSHTQSPGEAVESREGGSTDDLRLRKKELIDRVVARSGVKKKDAKPVVEALLAELGDALASEREMVLPPLGKLSVNRQKSLPNGRVLILKVRQRDTDVILESVEPNDA